MSLDEGAHIVNPNGSVQRLRGYGSQEKDLDKREFGTMERRYSIKAVPAADSIQATLYVFHMLTFDLGNPLM